MRAYILPVAVAGLLLVLHAFEYGRLTYQKREATPEQKEFVRRLSDLPKEVGDWQSDEFNIDKRQLEAAASLGSYARVFHNRFDPKKMVQIFIVCGHPQDVTLHTPDRCYKASGFKEDDEERKFPVDYGKSYGDKTAYFWTNRFKMGSDEEGSQTLRIFWSFSDDGNWQAPNFARFTLGAAPALYKIYAISTVKGSDREQPTDSACNEFLQQFIPVMNAALFPSAANAQSVSDGKKADAEKADSEAKAPAIGTTEAPEVMKSIVPSVSPANNPPEKSNEPAPAK